MFWFHRLGIGREQGISYGIRRSGITTLSMVGPCHEGIASEHSIDREGTDRTLILGVRLLAQLLFDRFQLAWFGTAY